MIAGFRLYEAPNLSEIGENDPKEGSSQVLGVFGGSYILVYMQISLKATLLGGWAGGGGESSRHEWLEISIPNKSGQSKAGQDTVR